MKLWIWVLRRNWGQSFLWQWCTKGENFEAKLVKNSQIEIEIAKAWLWRVWDSKRRKRILQKQRERLILVSFLLLGFNWRRVLDFDDFDSYPNEHHYSHSNVFLLVQIRHFFCLIKKILRTYNKDFSILQLTTLFCYTHDPFNLNIKDSLKWTYSSSG